MKTSTRKPPKSEFALALAIAAKVMNELHPRTRLAYYCEVFRDENEQTTKELDAEQKALVKPMNRELNNFRADHAVEKEGALQSDDKGNYKFSKENEKAVLKKMDEITESITQKVEEFMKEPIDVTCIYATAKHPSELADPKKPEPGILVLPADISTDTIRALNGFVFKYTNPFEEEIQRETEKPEQKEITSNNPDHE